VSRVEIASIGAFLNALECGVCKYPIYAMVKHQILDTYCLIFI